LLWDLIAYARTRAARPRHVGEAVQPHYEAAIEFSRVIREFQFESIDEVLHWFSSNPDIVELGKAAIVREILQAERVAQISLFRPVGIQVADYTPTWLSHFLSMAIGALKREQVGNVFANVVIINFNYDRIIEHFIYSELQTRLKVRKSEAQSAISKLKMIRPYGSVGRLPWQDESASVAFGADLGNDHDALFALSKNVHTYTEQALTENIKNELKEALVGARLIVILGFGFHQQNMDILKVKDRVGVKQVIATTWKIDKENYENMQSDIVISLACTHLPKLLPLKSADLMSTMKLSILNPAQQIIAG